jgi:hypothetical protein
MSPAEAKKLIGQRRRWSVDAASGPFTYTVTVFRAYGSLIIEQDACKDAITNIWCDFTDKWGRPSQVWFTPEAFLAMPYAEDETNRS